MADGEYLQSLGVQVFKRAIVHEATNSEDRSAEQLARFASRRESVEVIIDELHEVRMHCSTSCGRRSALADPLLMVLTTAGPGRDRASRTRPGAA